MKILLIGHKRHGKDVCANIIKEEFGLLSKSSSMAAAEIFIFDGLKDEFNYTSVQECWEDRTSDEMRVRWFNMIADYNKHDETRLAKEILKDNDIYIGLRRKNELDKALSEGLFDYVIGIYNPDIPKESEKSFDIDIFEYSDFIIPSYLQTDSFEEEFPKFKMKVKKIMKSIL